MSDIEDAVRAIGEYLADGDLHQGVVYDVRRAPLMEIGEAVKHIDATLLDHRPEVEWKQIARMRDVPVHHYHDTDFGVVEAVIGERLPTLRAAVAELKRIDASGT